MAFDDLTPNQIDPLIQLIEALNSGSFRDEFDVVRRIPPRSYLIRLHSNSGDSVHEMEGFYATGLHALNEAGYITITAEGRASLKPKAFQEYGIHNNRKQSPKAMNHDTYLRLLVTLYNALGGNLRKSVNLADVLKNEGLSQSELEGVMEYMIGEGWVEAVSDESLDVYFKHPGIKAAQSYRPSNPNATSENQNVTAPKDARKVFVVHGRNLEARNSLFRFLRSINLTPLEWSQAISMTDKASPFIGEILDVAFSTAQAVVVLMTPDDVAELREPFRSSDDPPYESQPTGQARPNVLFEAGMAMGRNPDRTIIVELGTLRPFSDIAGRHTVRLSNDSKARHGLAQRLETAGCPVDLTGSDWHTEGNFDLPSINTDRTNKQDNSSLAKSSSNKADQPSTKKRRSSHTSKGVKNIRVVKSVSANQLDATGDTTIDRVLQELKQLESSGSRISESALLQTLKSLFNRPAFYDIREESWDYFLYPLCVSRLLLENYIRFLKSSPQVRQSLGQVIRLMVELQNDVARIYGPAFSITDHIARYITNRDGFIDSLPPIVESPDYQFFNQRNETIREIRDILRPLGLVDW